MENLDEVKKQLEEKLKEVEQEYLQYEKTIDELQEYGYETVFNSNSIEEGYKSAFLMGRKMGELEGKIDELQMLISYVYLIS